jgi:hypothetical protein
MTAPSPPCRPDTFDVVIFGSEFADWLPVLDKASPLWARFPQVGSVTHIGDDGIGDWPAAERRLVIPLREPNSDACPPGGWGLVPDTALRAMLGDKGWLAAFARAQKLTQLMPKTYASADDAIYPCILKCTCLHAGHGVALVRSRAELDRTMTEGYFAEYPVMLQEYIEAPVEHTTHAICVGGRVVWHATYEYAVQANDPVRRPSSADEPRPVLLDARDIADMERLFSGTRYDGVVNIDTKRTASGRIAVMEINTRFGGSLFRPSNQADLVEALRVLIANAKWRGPATAVVSTPALATAA